MKESDQKDGIGKVALVTGGATGIGLSVAATLSGRNYRVIIGDIDETRGREAAERLGVLYVRLDVADERSWSSAIGFVEENAGRLDVLVNNAGIYRAGNIEDVSVADWMALQSVNVVGVILGCQYAIKAMKERGGSIINISSGAALRPKSTAAAYSASKSAVRSLTRTTALHCGEQKYNIRCNSIHPGMVDTEMVSGRVEGDEAKKELYDKSHGLHPLGRMADAVDIAAAVAFLASDEASYITGVALPVDGGYAID